MNTLFLGTSLSIEDEPIVTLQHVAVAVAKEYQKRLQNNDEVRVRKVTSLAPFFVSSTQIVLEQRAPLFILLGRVFYRTKRLLSLRPPTSLSYMYCTVYDKRLVQLAKEAVKAVDTLVGEKAIFYSEDF